MAIRPWAVKFRDGLMRRASPIHGNLAIDAAGERTFTNDSNGHKAVPRRRVQSMPIYGQNWERSAFRYRGVATIRITPLAVSANRGSPIAVRKSATVTVATARHVLAIIPQTRSSLMTLRSRNVIVECVFSSRRHAPA